MNHDLFAKVEDGEYTRLNVTQQQARLGQINFPTEPDEDDFRDIGYWPITGTRPAEDQWQHVTGPTYSVNTENRTVERNYTVTDYTLAERKEVMEAAIKAKRETLIAAGFSYAIPGESPLAYHTYQIDMASQNNMAAVQVRFIKGGSDHHGGQWRSADNVDVDMSDAEVQALFDAVFAYKRDILLRGAALLDAARAAADTDDLDDINVDAGSINEVGGWPANGS